MKKYEVGRHRITIAENEHEWTLLTDSKPAKIDTDEDGFTIDWS